MGTAIESCAWLEPRSAVVKVWTGWGATELSGYSIAPHLLYAILSETPDSELLPPEKLYIAHHSGISPHQGYLADVYKRCGCFDELSKTRGWSHSSRELGDACWKAGDYDAAEAHYRASNNNAQPHQNGPHDDRLLKLAFAREQWQLVVERFATTSFSSGFSEGTICCGIYETAALPYLELIAIALNQLAQPTPAGIQLILERVFRMSSRRFAAFRRRTDYSDPRTIEKIKKRCIPRFRTTEPLSTDAAITRGNTPRAQKVLEYLRQCDHLVNEAQLALNAYGASGDEEELKKFVEIVTGSGLTSVSHCFLFSAMGHDSFAPADAPPLRMARLYSCHPVMNKRHFGRLLDLKFKHNLPLTGEDILTGLFQQRGSLNSVVNAGSFPEFFDVRKLAQVRGWAALRLDEWIQRSGAAELNNVADTWRSGGATPVCNIFGGSVARPPESPRNMAEWQELLSLAAKWLESQWNREIGATMWISENQLFRLLKRKLPALRVVQHAQPAWLAPQHLDILIPEVAFAIEYMGRQHYEPIGFFGGETGFEALRARDQRKQQLCTQHDTELHFVRYDEDIAERADELIVRIKAKQPI